MIDDIPDDMADDAVLGITHGDLKALLSYLYELRNENEHLRFLLNLDEDGMPIIIPSHKIH